MTTLRDGLVRRIYQGVDPFTDVAPGALDARGWDDGHRWLELMIGRDGLYIEVGTWLGASALRIAGKMRAREMDACLVCVDTWLGGADHWEQVPEQLRRQHGRAELYGVFLANVVTAGLQDYILPLPLSSVAAARYLLRLLGPVAAGVYVDASHEYEDVCADLGAYWDLLRPGGVLLADDVQPGFPGVLRAWQAFTASKLGAQIDGAKGCVIKP